jgi:hypothetical protein
VGSEGFGGVKRRHMSEYTFGGGESGGGRASGSELGEGGLHL